MEIFEKLNEYLGLLPLYSDPLKSPRMVMPKFLPGKLHDTVTT